MYITIFTIGIGSIIVKFLSELYIPSKYPEIMPEILQLIIQYSKVLIATAITLFFIKFIKFTDNNILKQSDKYSFEIYIVHQLFILGDFSLMEVTNLYIFNIFTIIICIFISAYILKKISTQCQSLLYNQ